MHSDAFYIDLTGTLTLGAAAALLLALLGMVVTLSIATRDQQVSFALLRALGSGPRRIRRQVMWEHGVVCTVGLALGGLVGVLLTEAMAPTLPTLIFTSGLGGRIENGGLPVRVVWPTPALALTIGILAAVCAITMALAARAAARPALAGVLRLNED
jgi:ABC-type antimicrobial peptide transport system permease subunit